jgi:hypothetical protein
MKKYMAIFLGSPEALANYRAMETEMRKANDKSGMEAWGKWMEDNKNSIVEMGAPLGKTKRIDKNGVSDTKNELGAYVVVQAESHDDAAKMFINHPHFMIFPGDRVEVMECLPMPTLN